MKLVSENIKNALKQPTTQRKGRILVNGNYYEVYNVEYYADIYEDGNVIGNAIASQLDFDLPYMEKFDTFKYFDGVWTGNNYEYVDMGTFTVFDEQNEDEFNKHITAFDNLIKFNAPFEEVGTYPKTLYQELQDICEQAGVELVNNDIPNGNFEIENNQFVNGENLKTVLKAICQISGNYAIIKEDKLVLQLTDDTDETIIKSQHEPTTWKRKSYGINQVILQLGDVEGEYVIREDAEDISKNGIHKLVITNNPFAYTQNKRDTLIDELFNQVRGFGYIPYEMNYEWLNYLEIGDKITIDDIETIVLRIQGKSPKSLESVMAAPATIDSSVEYVDNTDNIKNKISRVEIIVDKQNQMIQSIADKVVDVSNIIKSVGSITLENAYEGLLHKLTIKGNISSFYPQIIYPSNDLYPQKMKLKVDEDFYDLDLNYLVYINDEIADEFICEEGKCKIIRRVGIDGEGIYYPLENEIVEEKEDLFIKVKKDSTIFMVNHSNVILTAEYLLENKYTNIFASEVELNSQIKQTAEEINLEVVKKVNDDEIISKINQSAEQIQIDANKISLKGKEINLTADNLNVDSEYLKINKYGEISIIDDPTTDEANFSITGGDGSYYNDAIIKIKSNGITLDSKYSSSSCYLYLYLHRGIPMLMTEYEGDFTSVAPYGITTPLLTQTSLKERKKNFEVLENALDIIKETNIYKYHLKSQSDEDKKHIGFVIGEDFNYSKEITSSKNDGADIYSMISVCFKAIQEQQAEIEMLKEMINNGL